MIVANSILIGLTAGMTRSAVSIALAATLILVAFAAAALSGSVSWMGLALAYAGFNLGLMVYLTAGIAASLFTRKRAH